MELQQRCSGSMNEYEDCEGIQGGDTVKTEDVYECLHQPSSKTNPIDKNARVMSERSWRKYACFISALNILTLTITLAVVGMSYSPHKETHLLLAKEKEATNEENWLLHDNVFYLFWRMPSDCSKAVEFCAERDSSLVTLTDENKFWFLSKANGEPFLVSRTPSEESGESALEFKADTFDEDYHQCSTMNPDSENNQEDGFVCERKASNRL